MPSRFRLHPAFVLVVAATAGGCPQPVDTPSQLKLRQSTVSAISGLRVEPDPREDFDADACRRLLSSIAEAGITDINDLQNVTVSLEDFFVGNRTKHSIAANVEPPPPHDTAAGWFELLKSVRETEGIHDVRVAITMIEPYADGRVGMWPYSDTVWINASLGREEVAQRVEPLQPDEVGALAADAPPPLTPKQAAPGTTWYVVWWD